MRVGPVLMKGSDANAVIAAIREVNREVAVVVRASYLRISVPNRCVLSRALVEKYLERPFVLPGDLELIMPAFQGQLRVTPDVAIWEQEI